MLNAWAHVYCTVNTVLEEGAGGHLNKHVSDHEVEQFDGRVSATSCVCRPALVLAPAQVHAVPPTAHEKTDQSCVRAGKVTQP